MVWIQLLMGASFAQEPQAPALGAVTEAPRFIPGKGLVLASDDGRFSIATRLRAQWLYTVLADPAEDATLHSFQLRRARLQFGGHVFGEHNRYKAELAFSPRDEGVDEAGPTLTPLLDWYAEFDYLRDLSLRIGQYKVPFNRQRLVSSGNLQMVDRSIAQSEFSFDRDVGLHVFSEDLGGLDLFKYYVGAWIEQGRDAREARPFHPMYVARVEVLPFGDFDDYSEGDLDRSGDPGLSVGAAYAFLDDARNERGVLGSPFADGGTADLHVVTTDLLFKLAGLSLTGELYLRRGHRDAGDAVDPAGEPIPADPVAAGEGGFVQAGYLLPPVPLEITARYDALGPASGRSPLEEEHAVGGGLSWYFAEHPLKLQADYFRLWGADGPGEGADQVRMQLQMAY